MNLNESLAGQFIDNPGNQREIKNLPLSLRLKDKLKYHQEQIVKINQTLDLLESNKDFERLLFLIGEVH